MKVLGIDASVTCTGLVVLQEPEGASPVLCHAGLVKVKDLRGLERCSAIAERVLAVIETHKPDRVVIEGYAYANAHTLVMLVELGTVLRYFLRQLGVPYLEPSPNQLKKFVTGSGNAKKSEMLKGVFQRWAFDTNSEDLADAYGLACMGLARSGKLAGATKDMLSIIGTLVVK